MTQMISKRLEELRTRRSLTRAQLAAKTKSAAPPGVDQQTIYRIEAGHQKAVRRTTVERLAAGLSVSPDVLTGEAPLPESEPTPTRTRPSNDEDYSINVPVDGAIRNAFTLAAMRYRVPIARIVELAPFLFVLAAEASLERRRVKLKEVQDAFDNAQDLAMNILHLPSSLLPSDSSAREFEDEKRSISTRDILGESLPDSESIGSVIERDYDESRFNPFVVYLEEAARVEAGVASIRSFDRSSTEYDVCYNDALTLVGPSEEKLANSIINGEILLHKMPRELLRNDSVDARIAWLREKREAYHAARPAMIAVEDLL